jgi:uncharacterized cupin superfamily protein
MGRDPVPEAELVQTEAGLAPANADGWFVVNLDETMGAGVDGHQYGFSFEGATQTFPNFGINVTVLGPGEPAAMYHAEPAQEAFLVLHGECVLIIEDEERHLRLWDFVHCPPQTAHVIVGAETGPCAVLMVGGRTSGPEILYPTSVTAAKYRAGVETETDDPREAYRDWQPLQPGRYPWPPESSAELG